MNGYREGEGPVEDPDALRRAEEAVARDEPQPPGEPMDPERRWLPVAEMVEQAEVLLAMREALLAEGVEVGFEPYDPRESPGGPYRIARTFRLLVPEGRRGEALRVLRRDFPDSSGLLTGSSAASARPATSVSSGERLPHGLWDATAALRVLVWLTALGFVTYLVLRTLGLL